MNAILNGRGLWNGLETKRRPKKKDQEEARDGIAAGKGIQETCSLPGSGLKTSWTERLSNKAFSSSDLSRGS